ncbi:type II secretion system protein [Deinococcus alpinitundrae]|uniref:type II secretion system protein n=1 Tax=Deinococcus alpinitundrae TaxID=468913 RepID=UPI001ED97533|nr:type II secretion system protein [Deinococcus alpinitundrae]
MAKMCSDGFTLLELLIVIAVIGILASVLITNLLGASKRSYDLGAQSCGKSIQTAQALSQVDYKTYLLIGTGSDQLNKVTDGVNSACAFSDMFVKERSAAGTIVSDYTIDVWDRRGSHVFTLSPAGFFKDAPGATAFSNTGAGGSNLP